MSVFSWLVPARPLGRIDYLKRSVIFTILLFSLALFLAFLSGGNENTGYDALAWLVIIPMAVNLWWRVRSCFVSMTAVWVWFLLAFFLPFIGIIFLFWPPLDHYETEATEGSNSRIVWVIVGVFFAIAFIGILAAVALPAYQTYVQKAKVSELSVSASGVKLAVEQYAASQYTWPESIGDLKSITLRPGIEADVREGVISIYFSGKPEQRLSFDPEMTGGKVVWTCSGSGFNEYTLPNECR